MKVFFGENPGPRGIEKYELRLPCCIVLDDSAAMEMWAPELQDMVHNFRDALMGSMENTSCVADISLMCTGGGRIVQTPFALPADLSIPALRCEGVADIRGALQKGVALLQERKLMYQMAGIDYLRPMLFLLTASAPEENMPDEREKERLHTLQKERKLIFCPVAIGAAEELDALASLHPQGTAFRLREGQPDDAMQWVARCIRRAAGWIPDGFDPLEPEGRISRIRSC